MSRCTQCNGELDSAFRCMKCGWVQTVSGTEYSPPKTHPDERDARITQLDRELAEARERLEKEKALRSHFQVETKIRLNDGRLWKKEAKQLREQLAEARRDWEIVSTYLNEYPNSELAFRMNAAMQEVVFEQKKEDDHG